MKRDFTQPFHAPKPPLVYVLAEYRSANQFLLLHVIADDFGDEWYTVPSFELPEGENTARLLAKSLDGYGLVLERFREVARETAVSYSFVDDTPGEQRECICIHAFVEAVRPYKSEDTKAEFVSLDRIIELASHEVGDLPSFIGFGAAIVDCASYVLEPTESPSKHITNFTIFDQAQLDVLIKPFAPGMSRHITPIKYEALTPDMYCLLVRTHGKDDRYYYFVLLEYDFIFDLEKAKGIIAQWHGEVIEFLPPQQEAQDEAAATLEGLSYPYNKVYKGLLARVNRPTGDDYWATHVEIKPDDDIDAALAHLPEDQQTAIKKGMTKIKNGDQKRISIYIRPEGGYELFFYDPTR